MLAIQGLKKQLRGIRTTQKLTKAMRTVSTVKFSKLNEIYGEYSKYGRQCRSIFKQYGQFFMDSIGEVNPDAPERIIVMTSNKGLCGKFNAEILAFAEEKMKSFDSPLLVACGKKAIAYFRDNGYKLEKEYVFEDVPTYQESNSMLQELTAWRTEGKISKIHLIYPKYVNMMNQIPTMSELFSVEKFEDEDAILFMPDKETINHRIAKVVFRAMFYEYVLETAVGAQASTLMTMRSAYDTATEYYEELEGEINRMRQSAVTSDVLETSVERKEN
jgi:F-type H+-transporting ATPase subunit gamma